MENWKIILCLKEKPMTGSSGTIGFLSALTITLIVLKLLDIIAISWFWVISRLLITSLLFLSVSVIALIIVAKVSK